MKKLFNLLMANGTIIECGDKVEINEEVRRKRNGTTTNLSMTVEEKFQYIKDKGHIIDPHELDIFFQFENPDKPTKSELRTLDLIVGEIMSEWRYLKWEE